MLIFLVEQCIEIEGGVIYKPKDFWFNIFNLNIKPWKILSFHYPFKRNIFDKSEMSTNVVNPLIHFYKKDIFYKLNDLNENMYYQDTDLFYQCVKNARLLRFTKKCVSSYWECRPGSSTSQINQNHQMKVILDVTQKTIDYGVGNSSFYKVHWLMKDKMKENNWTFDLKNKLDLKWFNWWIRIYMKNKYKKYVDEGYLSERFDNSDSNS